MRILVVEDDPRIHKSLVEDLRRQHYTVDVVEDGLTGLDFARTAAHDVILLDILLPGLDGFELCRRLRSEKSKALILMITARAAVGDKVRALDAGADDYVVKPFQIEEVMARVRALIRRAAGQLQTVLCHGALTLDPRTAKVTLEGAPVRLTSQEYRVLSYLMHHGDRVVSQIELTEHIYAQDFERDSNTLEVFIGRLRRKLGASSIETVRGLGYRMGRP